MGVTMAVKSQDNMYPIVGYECELSSVDRVGDSQYFESVLFEFGLRAVRGSAIGVQGPGGVLGNAEIIFRDFLSREPIVVAVEIGTWRGVSAALIAHYACQVHTIDIMARHEPYQVWSHFGVLDKISQHVVPSNAVKAHIIERMEFDFAFIDGMHNFESVQLDFSCVSKCGRVLFHDYQVMTGVTEFIDTLPDEQVIKEYPFAYWKADGHSES